MKTHEPPRNLPPRRRRQSYDWPPEAEKLARQRPRIHPSNLIRQLQQLTGYPLDACWRFAHKFGVQRPTRYRSWPRRDQERVLEMSETRPIAEIAKHFGVSAKAIYHVIANNQRQVSRRSEWFGLHAIARYLTVKPARVRSWIVAEKLKCVVEVHGKLKYTMVSGAELLRFCRAHKSELLRQRIPEKRILFLVDYVIPADVSDDYTARSSKLERAAFERGEYLDQASRKKESQAHSTNEEDEEMASGT
jgi:hypothetical protein